MEQLSFTVRRTVRTALALGTAAWIVGCATSENVTQDAPDLGAAGAQSVGAAGALQGGSGDGSQVQATGGTDAAGGDGAGGGGTGGADDCPQGETLCADQCVNLTSNSENCGVCGNVCPVGQLCSAGVCTTSCAAGLTACGQSCVDLGRSVFHCGACDAACSSGQTCVNGQCVATPTGEGEAQPTAPLAAEPEAATEEATEDSGCRCSAPGAARSRSGLGLSSLLGLLALSRRRRQA